MPTHRDTDRDDRPPPPMERLPARVADRALVIALPLLTGYLLWRTGIAADVSNMMGPMPKEMWVGILVGTIGALPAVFLHELGHAVVARRLLGGEVRIRVGSAGRLAELQLGGITATINAFGDPRDAAGVAEFDGRAATVDEVILIALAGPWASVLGLLLCALPLAVVSPYGIVHHVFWGIAADSLLGVANLLPLRFRMSRGDPLTATDGRVILDALKVKWTLR